VSYVEYPALVTRTLYQAAWTSQPNTPSASVVMGFCRLRSDMSSEPFGTAVYVPSGVSERSSVAVAPLTGKPHWSTTVPLGSMYTLNATTTGGWPAGVNVIVTVASPVCGYSAGTVAEYLPAGDSV